MLLGGLALTSRGISKGRLEASLNISSNDVTCLTASTGALAASSSNRLFNASPSGPHGESKRIEKLILTQRTFLLLKQLQYLYKASNIQPTLSQPADLSLCPEQPVTISVPMTNVDVHLKSASGCGRKVAVLLASVRRSSVTHSCIRSMYETGEVSITLVTSLPV